jgi:hypothetical protein
MLDLIERAKTFATGAHQRIDHRRKYSGLSYDVHLVAVAGIVASVTDDAPTIAAAWLHDAVEDTPVTLDELQREFGDEVAALVGQLTDISLASHGNRAARKDIDRRHLAAASPRAKTVKLADLIDNCEDITKHDPRFARVFLREMEALLGVLGEGDARLLQRAQALHESSLERLDRKPPPPAPEPVGTLQTLLPQLISPRIVKVFRETFCAGDVFDPLISFDADRPAAEVARVLQGRQLSVAGLRIDGVVRGHALLAELLAAADAPARQSMQPIAGAQRLDASASLIDVVGVLTRHDRCFVSAFDAVVGVIEREAVNKPVVRMWLFGVLSLYEMGVLRLIERAFPGDSWQAAVPPGRLLKAQELQQERERRNRHSRLIDCLQFGDKSRLILEHPPSMAALGIESRRMGKSNAQMLESLRNHLVHSQDIVAHDWVQIIRLTQRVAELGGE